MSQTGVSSKSLATSSANAASAVDLVDDFITGVGTGTISVYGWEDDSQGANSGIFMTDIIDADHPGIATIASGTTAAGTGALALHDTTRGSIVLGSGTIVVKFYAKLRGLSDGTNSYTADIGLGDSITSVIPNGLWFEYTHTANSGAWQIKAASASTTTTANTTNTADTNWHVFEIRVNADASSIRYFIDGVEVDNSPITTNITTSGIGPQIDIENTGGTGADRKIDLDLFTMRYELTNPR